MAIRKYKNTQEKIAYKLSNIIDKTAYVSKAAQINKLAQNHLGEIPIGKYYFIKEYEIPKLVKQVAYRWGFTTDPNKLPVLKSEHIKLWGRDKEFSDGEIIAAFKRVIKELEQNIVVEKFFNPEVEEFLRKKGILFDEVLTAAVLRDKNIYGVRDGAGVKFVWDLIVFVGAEEHLGKRLNFRFTKDDFIRHAIFHRDIEPYPIVTTPETLFLVHQSKTMRKLPYNDKVPPNIWDKNYLRVNLEQIKREEAEALRKMQEQTQAMVEKTVQKLVDQTKQLRTQEAKKQEEAAKQRAEAALSYTDSAKIEEARLRKISPQQPEQKEWLGSVKPVLPYLAYGLGGALAGWGLYDLWKDKEKRKDYKTYLKILLGSAVAALPLLLSQMNISSEGTNSKDTSNENTSSK